MALDINLIEDVGALNITTPTILDKSPYLYRQTPSGAGNIVSPTIIGGSVGWNQLADNSYPPSSRGGVTITGGDGFFMMNGTATAASSAAGWFHLATDYINLTNHVVYESFKLIAGSVTDTVYFKSNGRFSNMALGGERIAKSSSTYSNSSLYFVSGAVFTDAKLRVQTIDLTLMLGSTIADYVYGLEQSVSGSGIAWLKKYGFLTKSYYAYDSGSIQSVKTTGRQTRNSNDEIIATYSTDDVELRGIPKLDASNNLYYDGDTYEASGSVTRKYGIRAYQQGDSSDGSTMVTDGHSYTVYKLNAPTTESADPYTTPQSVGATEEFLDERDVPVPVGQESQYAQTQPYGLKIRLMEEGISLPNTSPLLRSASAPKPDTLTKSEPIGEVVKEPIKDIDEEPSMDTVKELPEDETEPEPEDEEVTEDDYEG